MKTILLVLAIVGYIFNMYYLTSDKNIREYQWINKIGIVIIPVGSVMGFVYIIDNNRYILNMIGQETK